MFTRNFIKLFNNLNKNNDVLKANIHRGPTCREKWDLLAAVCLERKPIITKELNDIEKQYKDYLAAIELERSMKNDTELKLEAEVKQLELLKKGADLDQEVSLKHTVQDSIDASMEELSKFKFGDRITEDDKKNNVKSLNRKLDRHLVFVLKQKLGDKSYFLLPQGSRKEGESLRQTADRIFAESFGKDIKGQIYGNAPSGFYKYKYPKDVRNANGTVGAKVFIYFARHINGNVPQKDSKAEFQWLDKDEMAKILPKEYYKSVLQMLVNE